MALQDCVSAKHLLFVQENRRAYRELFYTAPIGEAGISGAILFKETLLQSAADGTPFTQCLLRQGVLPGIKARAWGRGSAAEGGVGAMICSGCHAWLCMGCRCSNEAMNERAQGLPVSALPLTWSACLGIAQDS